MHVRVNHPPKELEIPGPKRVREVLRELGLIPEAYLVIRNDELVTEDEILRDTDIIDIRPVISGG
ncbi:MAG: thiamine biosynthesis protein ThiS [Nitrospirae bacterium]|nr:MAG: thiamine biosynthesis protein ThiS [Nitrospirota bacterium]